MRLPIQAQPVNRQTTTTSYAPNGIAPSDTCGCVNTCVGACIFGVCTGICV